MKIGDFERLGSVVRRFPIRQGGEIDLSQPGGQDVFSCNLQLQADPCPNYQGRGEILTRQEMAPEAYYREDGKLENITLNGVVDVAQITGRLADEADWAINPDTREFLIFERR